MRRSGFATWLIFLVLSLAPRLSSAETDEKTGFDEIIKNSAKNNANQTIRQADAYLIKYPKSAFKPDVYFLIGDMQSNPVKAIGAYQLIVNGFPKFNKRDLAHYRICEIKFMQSRYDECIKESNRAIFLHPKSPLLGRFHLMLIQSYLHIGRFEKAKDVCVSLMEVTHEPEMLSQLLLNLARIENKISGFSRSYISHLRDIAVGFPKSQEMTATLYLFGEFYEERKMFNHAYSSYKALIAKYPKSPEAESASSRIKDIMSHKPVIVNYLPDDKVIFSTESIDISPEIETDVDKISSFYAISIGPFDSLSGIKEIKGLLKEFQTLSVQRKNGYILYVGKCPNTDKALSLKIRLAEEFGINGSIVKFGGDQSRKYIYGE